MRLKTVQVQRKSGVTPDDFAQHLAGAGTPLVVTDGIDGWPARRKWSLEHFRAAYGADFVFASSGLFGKFRKLTKLSSFLDCLDVPGSEPAGFWLEPGTRRPLREPPAGPPPTHYLAGWQALVLHPELRADILPAPYFVEDWVRALDPRMHSLLEDASGTAFTSVLLTAAGAASALHCDYWNTHAYLAQVQGRKRALLFSPEDSARVYDGSVDPLAPDLAMHPLFAEATAYECVIEPGDVLFMPSGWWHWVGAQEHSITVSHNFFNGTNVNQYLTWLMRGLPALVDRIDASPRLQEELAIEWKSGGFRWPGR